MATPRLSRPKVLGFRWRSVGLVAPRVAPLPRPLPAYCPSANRPHVLPDSRASPERDAGSRLLLTGVGYVNTTSPLNRHRTRTSPLLYAVSLQRPLGELGRFFAVFVSFGGFGLGTVLWQVRIVLPPS